MEGENHDVTFVRLEVDVGFCSAHEQLASAEQSEHILHTCPRTTWFRGVSVVRLMCAAREKLRSSLARAVAEAYLGCSSKSLVMESCRQRPPASSGSRRRGSTATGRSRAMCAAAARRRPRSRTRMRARTGAPRKDVSEAPNRTIDSGLTLDLPDVTFGFFCMPMLGSRQEVSPMQRNQNVTSVGAH